MKHGLDGGGLLAGAATDGLPVPRGVAMAGYVERRAVSQGVHDRLEVGAVALCQGSTTIVLVAVDLDAVDASFVAAVATGAGISPCSLLLAASHTHSGPTGVTGLHAGRPVDTGYRAHVTEVISQTIRRALAALQPAALRITRADAVGVAAHRNDPTRPVDHRMTTIMLERDDGRPLACLLQFACHPTVLGPRNLLISADFPGVLRARVRERFPGTDVPVLFFNGASGDVSTRFTRNAQDFRELDRLGRILADSVVIPRAMTDQMEAAPLRVGSASINLPGKPIPTIGEAQRRLADVQRDHETACRQGADPAVQRRLLTTVQGAAAELARAEGGGLPPSPVTLCAVRVGTIALLGISAEVSSAVGTAVEARSPFRETVVIGLANDYCGYIVGGGDSQPVTYEALTSPFADQAAGALVDQAEDHLRQLL